MKTIKHCNGCNQDLEVSKFSKKTSNSDGLRSRCKECENIASKKYQAENREEWLIKKRTRYIENAESNRIKAVEEYQANKEKYIEKARKYREANPDKVKESHKKYTESHKEEVTRRKKIYNTNNRDKNSASKKLWNEIHKEENKITRKEWESKNKDKVSLYKRLREAKQKQLPATLTVEQWQSVKDHFGNKCAYCGRKSFLTKDHFRPLSLGGEYTINNIIPACTSCNSSKSDRPFETWFVKYKYYSKQREQEILKFLNYDKNNNQQLSLVL